MSAPADGECRHGHLIDVPDDDEQTRAWRFDTEAEDDYEQLTDLEQILGALEPRLHPGTYAVVSVREQPASARPHMTMQEEEGLTMLLDLSEAERLRLRYELPLAWITLGAFRAIGSIGLVSTVTSALAQAGIASVAGVGRWHTHLFVPAADAERAMKVLTRLSATHASDD